MATILIADDEASILQLNRMYLTREGYTVHAARDGQEAVEMTRRVKPDLIVLDLMMPRLDGWEVCRQLRKDGNPPPIIMLTAKDEDVDKVVGLEMGADDYVTKPFNPRELLARIKAILRRRGETADPNAIVEVGDLRLDPARHELRLAGEEIALRTQEFELLKALAQSAGRVMTREQLLAAAWGYQYLGESRTVDVHVAGLRQKLERSSVQIQSVRGIGYKLVETAD